jgi:hypothetical protein
MGTHWELEGNMLGTKENFKNKCQLEHSLPPGRRMGLVA